MTENLNRIPVTRRDGSERFSFGEEDLGFDLLGFWQWSASDLVSNTMRGVLAEYLVARALGIDVSGVRDGWAACDLCTPSGVKVEVKSAAYLQSWHQAKPSAIVFRTPRTRAWDPDTNCFDAVAKRQADVYVFALLAHEEKSTLDPCDVSQWKSYVLSTLKLNERKRSQHSIALPTLSRLSGGPVGYRDLAKNVEEAAAAQQDAGPDRPSPAAPSKGPHEQSHPRLARSRSIPDDPEVRRDRGGEEAQDRQARGAAGA